MKRAFHKYARAGAAIGVIAATFLSAAGALAVTTIGTDITTDGVLTINGNVNLNDASADTLLLGQNGGTPDTVTIAGNVSLTDTDWSITAAGVFTGNGSGLTTLNASNISSGTLSALRLPTVAADYGGANVNLNLSNSNVGGFNTNLTIDGTLTVGGITSTGNVTMSNATIMDVAPFSFEGTTVDANDTSLIITDPTANRTQTLQNNSGIIPLGTGGNTLFFTTAGATNVTLPTTGTLATLAGTETLTNKTLTNPIISFIRGPSGTNVLALTETGGAVNYLRIVNTLTGTSPSIELENSADTNVGLVLQMKGTGALTVSTNTATTDKFRFLPAAGAASFTGTITSADLGADSTWTIPAGTDTFAMLAATQTLTNKTITAIGTSPLTLTQTVATSGSPVALTLTGAAHTTLAASTEASDVDLNLARTVQFATGALAVQRAVSVKAPTYAFVAPSTITHAATLAVDGPPNVGTNATITNPYAFWVQFGKSQLDGGATVQSSLTLGPLTTHIKSTQTTAPTAAESGAGTPTVTANSSDTTGTVTTSTTSHTTVTVTFNATYTTAPFCVISPGNAAAAAIQGSATGAFVTTTATTMVITTAADTTAAAWTWQCIGY